MIAKTEIITGITACINEYENTPWFREKKLKVENIFDRVEIFNCQFTQGHIGWLGNSMYIVFRGSDEKGDWWGKFGNFNIRRLMVDDRSPLTTKIETDAWVFEGFKLGWKSAKYLVLDAIDRTGPSEIWVCGHSRGAAIAAICAENISFILNKKKPVYGVYVSSPRPGNEAFRQIHDARVDASMIYIRGDVVPCLPTLCMGARAVGCQIGLWGAWFPPISAPHYPQNVLQAAIKGL